LGGGGGVDGRGGGGGGGGVGADWVEVVGLMAEVVVVVMEMRVVSLVVIGWGL